MVEKLAHKAVLIYPEFDTQDTFWSYATSLEMYDQTGEFGLPKRLLPPLGLMGLFNYLKPYYSELILVDRNVDPSPLEELIADASHIFMGGMSAQENNLIQIAQQVKKAGKLLVVGGTVITPHSPLMEIADYLVENEAEGVIDELLSDISKSKPKKYYKGGLQSSEQFFQPDYSAINMRNYVHMAVQISRGCPEKCEFCDIPLRFGKAYRVTPQAQTENSFQQLKDLGWYGQVFVVDDNFIGNPRKALEVLKSLYQIGETLAYHHPKYTELTLRLADQSPIMEELCHWFQKTNFVNGFYGVETPNQASLLETDKRQNLRGEMTLPDKLRFISRRTGAGVMMGMIYGFDHDTNESVDEFIDFVNATNAPIVMAGLLNALPYTKLMQRLQDEGRIIQASSGNNSDGVINFLPYHFSVQQAEQNYLKILQGIYQPAVYFKRVFRHLSLIDPSLQSQYRTDNQPISLLIKILSKKNALIYWRYLPQAILLSVKRGRFNATVYRVILAEYFSLCGQYTHFSSQVDAQKQKLKQRDYKQIHKKSWLDMTDSVAES